MADYRVPIGQTTFDAIFSARTSGILAAIRYRVDDNDGNVVIGPALMDAELGTTGVYRKKIPTPGTEGEWSILYSKDGSFSPTSTAIDYLVTYDPGVTVPDVPPLTPISDDGSGQAVGPCDAWTSEALVLACCAEDSIDDVDGPIVASSQVLFALSNGIFPGTCERRVRPCGSICGGPWQNWAGWGWMPTNRDLGVYGSWGGYSSWGGCGCSPMDRIGLAGGAREILEVTIDGQIVDPVTYRLDERRWLVRVPDPADPDTRLGWPACQDMTRDETEDGTFSILYTYGNDPPVAGQYAATELACAIHQTCAGGGAAAGAECALPTGVTRIQRQGITIDLDAFRGWGWENGKGWHTGLPLVDLFLNAYAPEGRQARTRVWSPDVRRFPRPVVGAS